MLPIRVVFSRLPALAVNSAVNVSDASLVNSQERDFGEYAVAGTVFSIDGDHSNQLGGLVSRAASGRPGDDEEKRRFMFKPFQMWFHEGKHDGKHDVLILSALVKSDAPTIQGVPSRAFFSEHKVLRWRAGEDGTVKFTFDSLDARTGGFDVSATAKEPHVHRMGRSACSEPGWYRAHRKRGLVPTASHAGPEAPTEAAE